MVGKAIRLMAVVLLGAALGSFSLAFALGRDREPNNSCSTAQKFGAVTLPFTVAGSLDTPPGSPDVDFFRFTGPANRWVRIDLEGVATGKGTLPNPLLAALDESCLFLGEDDDGGVGTNSSLRFIIPDDGIFVLAATSWPDFGLTGDGFSSGSYQLTITLLPLIGSISGRIVDAISREPLRGDTVPFAFVELRRCSGGQCFESVNSQFTDSNGRFRFDRDSSGIRLTVDTYKVHVSATQYQDGDTAPFNVAAGQNRNLGAIPLTPFPVQFSELRPCGNLPPEGGTCGYSVRVRNGLPTRLTGAVWSVVDANGIGSFKSFSRFQTGAQGPEMPTPLNLGLGSGQSTVVEFQFQVPSTVANGAFICAETFVGQGPTPSFETLGESPEFCISKQIFGFTLVPERQVQQQFQQLRQLERRTMESLGKAIDKASGSPVQ